MLGTEIFGMYQSMRFVLGVFTGKTCTKFFTGRVSLWLVGKLQF